MQLLFAIFELFLPGKRARSQVKRLELKFDKSYFMHTIPGQLSVKKKLVPTFSTFAAIDHKGHFRKILTRIFKFRCFSWFHTPIFEKNELDLLMQNLMLNQLTPISNSKNEKSKKLVCPFLIALFYFEAN